MSKIKLNRDQIKFCAKARVILSGKNFIKLLEESLNVDGLTKVQANKIRNLARNYYYGKIELNYNLLEVL